MANSDQNESVAGKPSRLRYEQILDDLNSISVNQTDVLFNLEDANKQVDTDNSNNSESNYSKLEKLLLFKANLEADNENTNKDSLSSLKKEIESVDKRLSSLQHFIEISEKFLSINK